MVRLTELVLLAAALPTVFATDNLAGLYGLVKRRIPQHANSFQFKLVNGTGDSFIVSDTPHSSNRGVTVECTTISACARGLYTCVLFPVYLSDVYEHPTQVSHRVRKCRHLVDWLTPARASYASSQGRRGIER